MTFAFDYTRLAGAPLLAKENAKCDCSTFNRIIHKTSLDLFQSVESADICSRLQRRNRKLQSLPYITQPVTYAFGSVEAIAYSVNRLDPLGVLGIVAKLLAKTLYILLQRVAGIEVVKPHDLLDCLACQDNTPVLDQT